MESVTRDLVGSGAVAVLATKEAPHATQITRVKWRPMVSVNRA